MSKRERTHVSTSAEGSRVKKRKNEVPSSSEDPVMNGSTAEADTKTSDGANRSKDKERELANMQGLVLWQTVKDAVNKEDRVLSIPFMQRPPKKLYPDYYQQIQQPVFLDDIKKKLDNKAYPSFEAVKQDFELCFVNAKNYNQRTSQIWKDAKHLHKLVLRECARIAPSENDQADIDGEAGREGASEKKSKAPNMYRVLKSRLTKLIEKTDDDGRILSEVFMELPSKKEWPIYYKEIKRPQCIENIFKRLKRKEYLTASDFAADVELVFVNAMQFNQEHSAIWEDAMTLKNYFRQLMSDLPPPFALPEYSKPNKIKLKMPAIATASASATAFNQLPSSTALTATGGLLLRVPSTSATHATTSSDAKSKATAPSSESPASPAAPKPVAFAPVITTPVAPTPATRHPAPLPSAPTPPATVPPLISYTNVSYSQHYPNANYSSALGSSSNPAARSSTPKTTVVGSFVGRTAPARSVTPPPVLQHPLKCVKVKVEPPGRLIKLDQTDGVKSWVLHMGPGEKSLALSDVTFVGIEEEESSAEEDEEDRKEEEEEEEQSAEVEVAPRRRGRPRKVKGKVKAAPVKVKVEKTKVKDRAVKKSKKTVPPIEDVQVKLDGNVINPVEEGKGNWRVDVPTGSHVIEIGAKGGMVWKIFADRIGD